MVLPILYMFLICLRIQNKICDGIYVLEHRQEAESFTENDLSVFQKERIPYTYEIKLKKNVSSDICNMEMLVVKTNSWYPVLTKMRMKSGVFFNKVQTERNLKVAVINTKAAKTLFGSLNPVGNIIYLEETPFEIIGVSESLDGREEQLFVPEKSLHEIENVPIHQIWCVFSNMAESALMIRKMGLDYSMIKVDELKLVKKVFIQRLCELAIIFVICIIQKIEKSRGRRRKKVWNKLSYVVGGVFIVYLLKLSFCMPHASELIGADGKIGYYKMLEFYILSNIKVDYIPCLEEWNILFIIMEVLVILLIFLVFKGKKLHGK